MAWSDGYLDASFRGVQFNVKRASTTGGRRVAVHEFPRADRTETEDLGGVAKDFVLDAFLIGADYFDQRKRFEGVLDEGTVGILVHPYRGTSNVRVAGKYTITETGEEGGMCRFQIPFTEETSISSVVAVPNTPWVARSVKADTFSEILDNFAKVFAIKQKVGAAVETFQYGVEKAAGLPAAAVRDAREAFDLGLAVVDSAKIVAGSSAEFKREIKNCKGRTEALSLNLEYITETMKNVIDWGTEDLGSPRDQLRELRRIHQFSETIIGETSESEAFGYPARQVQEFIAQLAVVAQVSVFTETEFTTVEDAEEIRDQLFRDIDALSLSPNVSDDLYALLRDCKKAVFDDFQTRSLHWPRIRDVRLPETTNTLALLYSHYGDINDEQAFIGRNQIIHPGFVPGGVDLKMIVR